MNARNVQEKRATFGFALLAFTLGALLLVNLLSVLRANLLAAPALFVQAVVILFVFGRLPGAMWVVRVWSAILVLSAIAYWTSVAFQVLAWLIFPEGGALAERVTKFTMAEAALKTLTLWLGVYFCLRAPKITAVLPPRRGTGLAS